MDRAKFPELMKKLYEVVGEFEAMFSRKFTPDGHMVGSLGEALAAFHYGLALTPPSTEGCDATIGSKRIEIKATQGERVAFRCQAQHLLVLKLAKDGTFEEVYNGHGARVWSLVAHKPMPRNGQHQVSLAALRQLSKQVSPDERLARVVP